MPTTVTGTIQDLSGAGTKGTARFWLRGAAGNQPRVNGTSVIAPSMGGIFFFDIASNASGTVSGTVYSTRDATGTGNGDIEVGGSYTAVWYGLQFLVNGKMGPETPIHAKQGIALDISNVVPLSANPPVTAPTGDTTYIRLDGANLPSVTVAFSATPTFAASGEFCVLKLTLTGNVTSSTLTTAGVAAPGFFIFDITQDGSGGHSFVWPSNVLSAMAIDTTAGARSIQQFYWDGANAYALGPGTVYP